MANAEPLDKAAGNAAGTAQTSVFRKRAAIVSGLDPITINQFKSAKKPITEIKPIITTNFIASKQN